MDFVRRNRVALAAGVLLVVFLSYEKGHSTVRRQIADNLGKVIRITSDAAPGVSSRPDLGDDEAREPVDVALEFPLVWDANNGEYLMQFMVGGTSFLAVPDTGSEFVVLASEKCGPCPKRQGRYNMKGTDTGISDTIAYGSQTDKIEWFIDEFQAKDHELAFPLEFGSVTDVDGASNMNVFGLAGSLTFHEKMPFVDQVFFAQQILRPAFYFDFGLDAKLVLGEQTPHKSSGITVPMFNSDGVKAETGIDMHGLNYYFIRVAAMHVGGVELQDAPKMCMVDTGSTDTIVSTALYKQVEAGRPGNLVISFEEGLQIEAFRSDVASDDWLDGDPWKGQVFILGNLAMYNKTLSFDLQGNELTIVG